MDLDAMLRGLVCQYCERDTVLVTGAVIYPQHPAFHDKRFRYCEPCDAWVGCHDGTDTALGRVARAPDRRLRIEAYAVFDALWRRKMRVAGISQHEARSRAYAWLSRAMGLRPEYTHIGMMSALDCERVIEICSPHVK